MKQLVGVDIGSYTFNKTNKTITFTDCGALTLDNILLITNVTDHIILYNFADTTTTGTMTNNVLTLAYNTSTMSDTDNLQIYIDIPVVALSDLEDTMILFRRLLQLADSLGTVDINNRQRVAVEAVTAVTAPISTLGVALTGVNDIPTAAPAMSAARYYQGVYLALDQRWFMKDQARNTYANSIRSQIV